MFSFLNRELKIGNNRKTGIEAKQRGKGRNEREEEGEEDRERERDSKWQMKKAHYHPKACSGAPIYLYLCVTFSPSGVSQIMSSLQTTQFKMSLVL